MGTSYANLKFVSYMSLVVFFGGCFSMWKIVWQIHSPNRQWACDAHDLWNDDGTVLEGEESVANLKIQHERIMPFMDKLQAQIDEATA